MCIRPLEERTLYLRLQCQSVDPSSGFQLKVNKVLNRVKESVLGVREIWSRRSSSFTSIIPDRLCTFSSIVSQTTRKMDGVLPSRIMGSIRTTR